MSQSLSPFSFQALFNTTLQDYESQTGTRLINHRLAKKLESCNSVDSINENKLTSFVNLEETVENL
jgi:hypothetical protein